MHPWEAADAQVPRCLRSGLPAAALPSSGCCRNLGKESLDGRYVSLSPYLPTSPSPSLSLLLCFLNHKIFFSNWLNIELTYDPVIPLLNVNPKELKQVFKQTVLTAPSTIATCGNKASVHHDEQITRGPSYSGIVPSHKNQWTTDTSCNVDKPQKHDVQWKPDTQGHILYDSIYMK